MAARLAVPMIDAQELQVGVVIGAAKLKPDHMIKLKTCWVAGHSAAAFATRVFQPDALPQGLECAAPDASIGLLCRS